MADDNNWRDKVKSPSETNERMIGGKSSLPQKDGKELDWKKLNPTEEEVKYNKKLHEENLDKSFANKEKRAIKDYENRVSKPKSPDSKNVDKKLIDKIDDLVDNVGQGLKKAAPYLDDVAKVIGAVGKVGGVIGGVVEIFNPESTVDESTEQQGIIEWADKNSEQIEYWRNKNNIEISPEEKENMTISIADDFREKRELELQANEIEEKENILSELERIEEEQITAEALEIEEAEKENILLAMEQIEAEQVEIEVFEMEETEKENILLEVEQVEEVEATTEILEIEEEKENILLAMEDIEEEIPDFLSELKPEKEIEKPYFDFDISDPSPDNSDSSDGADGGDGGDGGE